ncbi:MAG: alpha/beta hydrolase [Pseudomonadota bacterium]
MTKFFAARDGRRLAYQDSGGDGPAVLCLAGLSRNHRDFEDLEARLAPKRRVIRLDSRGRGFSEHAVDAHAEYNVPTEAGDAIALLDHLGLSRVALIGTSRGGILSMAIAGAQPERVSGVVLNDVGAVIEGGGLLRILATLGRPPKAQSFEAAAADLKSANAAQFPNLPDAEWLRHAHRLYDDVEGRPTLAYDPHLRMAVSGAIEDGGPHVAIWPLFEALKTLPVLVIRGENSDILTAETLDAMREEHSGLKTVTLKDRGHAPFLNEPDATAAIEAFLDEADSA